MNLAQNVCLDDFLVTFISLSSDFLKFFRLGQFLSNYEGPAKSFVTGFGLLQCYVSSNIFITNLQSIPPLLKHIFVTFYPVAKSR